MTLIKELENRNFPISYKQHIEKIDLEKLSDFVRAMLNSIARTYGIERLEHEIRRDSSDSIISDHLTHIIEVGGLKIISDNELLVENDIELHRMILAVVITLNCSLAIEAENLGVYFGPTSHYYNHDAILELSKRLSSHINKGRMLPQGFDYFANTMVLECLISKFLG